MDAKAKPLRAIARSAALTGLRFVYALGLRRPRVEPLIAMPRYLRDLARYQGGHPRPGFGARVTDLWPILSDFGEPAGALDRHYFFQDLWAARRIFEKRARAHVDIGSRIDGFVAHLLCFLDDVTVIDVRPLELGLPGLRFIQDDATQLARFADGSLASVSSLHAAEHFGLGRYGDPVDPEACFRFMRSLQRVLAPGGTLYFSVPIGRERVEFNAHRVLSIDTVLETFSELTLASFSAVDDRGRWRPDVAPAELATAEYACGMFELVRPARAKENVS